MKQKITLVALTLAAIFFVNKSFGQQYKYPQRNDYSNFYFYNPYSKEIYQDVYKVAHDKWELKNDMERIERNKQQIKADLARNDWKAYYRDSYQLEQAIREFNRDHRDIKIDRMEMIKNVRYYY